MELNIQKKLIQWILQPLASFMGRFSEKKRNILFVAAGLVLFFQNFLHCAGHLSSVRYLVIFTIGCLMFGLMILAVMPSEIQPVRFDKLLIIPWAIVTLFMLIAGITKSVDYLTNAILMLVAFPVFYIIAEDFHQILHLLFRTVRISFYIFLLISFLFFPITEQKYSSFFTNVNELSFYLSLVFCCTLIELLALKKRCVLFFSNLASAGISAALVYYTNSRSGLLAVFVMFLFTIFLVMFIDKKAFFKTFFQFFLPVILSIAVFIPSTIYIFQIPSTISQAVTQPNQQPQPDQELQPSQEPQPGQTPQPAPPTVSDVLEKVQETHDLKLSTGGKNVNNFFTGRIAIWTAFVEHLSFWGHTVEERFYIEERKSENSTAHMTILQYAYSYGILAGVAYLTFNLTAGLKSIRYALKRPKDRYALTPFAVSVTFGALSLFSSLISPFNYIIVFYYYLVQVPLMRRECSHYEP